jgi:hypothetical protein
MSTDNQLSTRQSSPDRPRLVLNTYFDGAALFGAGGALLGGAGLESYKAASALRSAAAFAV